MAALTNAEKQKRFQQRRSLERERLYLARDWKGLGTDASKWTLKQCAVRKWWCIYYARRKALRDAGIDLQQRTPSKPRQPSINTCLVRHV